MQWSPCRTDTFFCVDKTVTAVVIQVRRTARAPLNSIVGYLLFWTFSAPAQISKGGLAWDAGAGREEGQAGSAAVPLPTL